MLLTVILFCTLCQTQGGTRATHIPATTPAAATDVPPQQATPAPVQNLSPTFAKAALRALYSMGTESEAITVGLLNDSSVEAETDLERKTVSDLSLLKSTLEVNKEKRTLRVETLSYINSGLDSKSMWQIYDNDSELKSLRDWESTCVKAMGMMLRSRVYTAVTSCGITPQ